jgi:hypothetical protein
MFSANVLVQQVAVGHFWQKNTDKVLPFDGSMLKLTSVMPPSNQDRLPW